MDKICVLKNPIQEYAWGSKTFIPQLLGERTPSDNPQAELWMGAHPKAPSQALCNGEWISLSDLIQKNPEGILGKSVAEKFSNQLPFLFKVLAAAEPLSIQAHPNQDQARKGFARENRQKIPLNAPHRNYKDQNHKPELICALTPFWVLKGLRTIEDITLLMDKIGARSLEDTLVKLRKQSDRETYQGFLYNLMTLQSERRSEVINEVIGCSEKHYGGDPVFEWMIKLSQEYPEDIGVLFPILLNLVRLQPGEAMYIPAGELHTYLEGAGIELMANSDNVLRGGLTAKHIDFPELLRILKFTQSNADVLRPEGEENGERIYLTSAEEFKLSVISVREGIVFESSRKRSVEIMICVKGDAQVADLGNGDVLDLTKGASLIVPAMVDQYRIEGKATVYKAMVPHL